MMKSRNPMQGRRRDDLRYRLFAEAYLDIGNRKTYLKAMQSALAAGYSESYSKHHSYKLVDQRGVQEWMKHIRESRYRCSTIASPEEVLETLTTILRTLPNELVNESGELLPLQEMSRDQAQAIAGVKVHERVVAGGAEEKVIDRRREYKLIDRLKAAEMLARHHGLFEVDNRQQVPKSLTLVAMPTGDMTLEEWQCQVMAAAADVRHERKGEFPQE